jgi:hypothetical protein
MVVAFFIFPAPGLVVVVGLITTMIGGEVNRAREQAAMPCPHGEMRGVAALLTMRV